MVTVLNLPARRAKPTSLSFVVCGERLVAELHLTKWGKLTKAAQGKLGLKLLVTSFNVGQ